MTYAKLVQALNCLCLIGRLVLVPPRFKCSILGGHHHFVSAQLRSYFAGKCRRVVGNALAQLAYSGIAKALTFNNHLASTGVQVESSDKHERGFPRAIGSKHHPVFTLGNIPRDIVQYGVAVALQGDVAKR